MECEFKTRPSGIVGECHGEVVYIVRNYFTKIIPPRKDRHIHLCESHAKMWEALHPLFAPGKIEKQKS